MHKWQESKIVFSYGLSWILKSDFHTWTFSAQIRNESWRKSGLLAGLGIIFILNLHSNFPGMEIRHLNLKYYWLSNSLQFLPFVHKFSANLHSVIIDACVQCGSFEAQTKAAALTREMDGGRDLSGVGVAVGGDKVAGVRGTVGEVGVGGGEISVGDAARGVVGDTVEHHGLEANFSQSPINQRVVQGEPV
jgi:hypothetical protein